MLRKDKSERALPAAARAAGQSVSRTVYALLRDLRMTTVFGNPGSTELRFFREWPQDFSYVLALQESSVVAMADGYAQASRNAAFVNLHSAAGIGHGMGSLFTAFRNQTPLVVTAGQQTRAMFLTEPYLFATDAAQFPKPYVKWSIEPARAQDVPAALLRAYHVAMQKPCGPVFLSIPEDDWDAAAEPLHPHEVARDLGPDPAALTRLAQALDACREPVIVVGPAVDQDSAWDEAVALAERLEAPVWVSPVSPRCSFPEQHRLFAGFLPPLRQKLADTLKGHDLVLVLGAPVFTYHVHTAGELVPAGAQLFHLTDDPDQAARTPLGLSIRCSLRLGLAQLLECIAGRPRPAAKGRKPAPPPRASDPLTPEYVLHRLSELMPEHSIVVEEAPTHRNAIHDYLPIKSSGGFYAGASGGLGWALPAAVGVQLAAPARRVVCVVGDGSSLYSIQALWTAVQAKAPVVFVVLNNQGYGALKSFCQIIGIPGAPGHDLPGIDLLAAAQTFGCRAGAIERVTDVDRALQQAFSAHEPWLLDVRVPSDVKRIY